MARLSLVIASVDKNIFVGDVELVTCPGSDGEFTLLAHHQALISTLKKGTVIVRESKDSLPLQFAITHGLLEVAQNKATILI